MILTIPDEILMATRMSEQEIRQELAILLFSKEKLTLAQAARLAGMPNLAFQQLASSRGLTVHYDVAEFEEDMKTLKELGRL